LILQKIKTVEKKTKEREEKKRIKEMLGCKKREK
jgi:hypothetical protein